MPIPVARFFDMNGSPLAGGLVYTYATGTTTPMATYTDASGIVANSNPVVLDSTGSASIWLVGNYSINLTDANGNQQPNYPQNGVQDLFTANNLTTSSTTNLTISSSSQTLTIPTGLYFPAGTFLLIAETAAPTTNWMTGPVTSYIGTQLVVNVQQTQGSGTFAAWTVTISGPPGPQGSTGAPGAGSGDVNGPISSIDGYVALFDGTSGALLKQGSGGIGTAGYLNVGTSANQVVQLTTDVNGNPALPAVSGANLTSPIPLNAARLTYQVSSGTNPGNYTSGGWDTVSLNTISFNPASIVSLASNQFTLSAGTYFIDGGCSAYVGGSSTAIWAMSIANITDSTRPIQGTVGFTASGGAGGGGNAVSGFVTISGTKTFQLQIYAENTTGIGNPLSNGSNEVFNYLNVIKIG